jgi:hypothetical protein
MRNYDYSTTSSARASRVGEILQKPQLQKKPPAPHPTKSRPPAHELAAEN